jgi:predicted ABC-type ATPase
VTTTPGEHVPRVVVIAGPNGSGKSTLTEQLRKEPAFPEHYVNADEIERSLAAIQDARERSTAAFEAAAVRREELFQQRADFAFETVFSHPDKILFLEKLRGAGYRIILHYVTTCDPLINRERVRQRVREGGHPVPEEKIAARYARCHQLFPRVIETVDEAFVFDASRRPAQLVFERVDGKIGLYPGLTPWAEAHLLRPLQERSEERTRVEADGAAAGVRLVLPDEKEGLDTGPVHARYRHYLLQVRTGDAAPDIWIRHDQALLERSLPEGAIGTITLRYQSGWATWSESTEDPQGATGSGPH